MNNVALILFCAFVAVQSRSAGVPENKVALAALGENPWVVHLRLAVSTSGLLQSCIGTLIGANWVLTAGSCVEDSTFIWVRLGAVVVSKPSLVYETNTKAIHESNAIALIDVRRDPEPSENYAPIGAIGGLVFGKAALCVYGSNEAGGAGEQLSCYGVTVEASEDEENKELIVSHDDVAPIKSDLGAALVIEGNQIGILTALDSESSGVYVAVSDFVSWIEDKTGLSFPVESEENNGSEEGNESSSSSLSSSSSSEEDSQKVVFVN